MRFKMLIPLLAAMLLRPRRQKRGPLGRFFALFNRWFEKGTHTYVRFSHTLIRKGLIAMLVSSQGKRLGDLAAGTIVVRLDRPGVCPESS